MTTHAQEKEALERAANAVLVCNGVTLGTLSFTQKVKWATDDAGNVSGTAYATAFTPSADVKAAIALYKGTPPSQSGGGSEQPTTGGSPEQPPAGGGTQPPAPSGSSFKFVRGLQVIAPSWPAAQPAVGASFTDPATGVVIERLTDCGDGKTPGNGGGLRNVYSRYPCENADGTLWIAEGIGSPAAWLVRVAGNVVVRAIVDADGKPIGEDAELHWDYTDPDTLYFVRGMGFYRQSASTGAITLVRDFKAEFPSADYIMTDVEGDSSHDSRYWCWMAMQITQTGSYPVQAIFTYDKQADKILGTLTFANAGCPQGTEVRAGFMPRPNMVEVSPDGRFALIDWERRYTGNSANLAGTHEDGPHVYPLTLDTSNAMRVGADATHSAWAADAAGKWLFVSQNNRNDWIEAADPDTGAVIQLINHGALGWNNGMHFCGARDLRGWVCLGTESGTQTDPGDNQLMLLPLIANGSPLRVCPTYNVHKDYFSEMNPSLSMDGTRIYWHGTWDGSKPVDTYRMQLPSDWSTAATP